MASDRRCTQQSADSILLGPGEEVCCGVAPRGLLPRKGRRLGSALGSFRPSTLLADTHWNIGMVFSVLPTAGVTDGPIFHYHYHK